MKPQVGIVFRIIIIAVFLTNAVVPSLDVLAEDLDSPEAILQSGESAVKRRLASQSPQYYLPASDIPPVNSVQSVSSLVNQIIADQPNFAITVSPGVVNLNDIVTLTVTLHNSTRDAQAGIQFADNLENGVEFVSNPASPVTYDPQKRDVSYVIDYLEAGSTVSFSYDLMIAAKTAKSSRGEARIHSAQIKYDGGSILKAMVSIGVATDLANPGGNLAVVATRGGWHSLGKVAVHLAQVALDRNSILAAQPVAPLGEHAPKMQYELKILRSESISNDSQGDTLEQEVNLLGETTQQFKSSATLSFDLTGAIDLSAIPAGQDVYVATYDDAHNIWVKIPIIERDLKHDTVFVEAVHFSTWGVGLGTSLPQNGANVLLFDQPFISLFTGAAQYSLPVWMPQGRNGMTPKVSLTYSSGTYNGVLGDVQGPWVGAGWNIDGVEIVRKITTSETGYGYANNYALTLNGTIYQLVQDSLHPNRYFTDHNAFLYIERHNLALGNAGAVANATGEWWEVITTDGMHYRLGWNLDSEQTALMYGYACTTGNPCITPDGTYASLGYAGKAANVVALRWRVDRVSDPHGNTIAYAYTEEQPSPNSTTPAFDRASYLNTISYAGTLDGGQPGYQVKFSLGERSTVGDNIPNAFNLWDNFDTKYLDQIQVCFGTCATDTPVRLYHLNYRAEPVPNLNGTLVLDNIAVSGGGYIESGISVPATQSAIIRFAYQNKDNRAVTGGALAYTYPRLTTIQNGYGASLAYEYENDGRGTNSWYNWRVTTASVNNGLGLSARHGYAYAGAVYTDGASALGELVGYSDTTDITYNLDGVTKKMDSLHHFGTASPDTGYELSNQQVDPVGTVLQKTVNTYINDNSKAPYPGWNYRYLYKTDRYIKTGPSLMQISADIFKHDPATGNQTVRETFQGGSLFRRQYFEYLSNFSPNTYILDKVTRSLVTDPGNVIYSDVRYHYDGGINSAPVKGDLTLVQRLVGGAQTGDTTYSYDAYGNLTRTCAYGAYGSLNTVPTGSCQATTTVYDSGTRSYPVEVTNALGNTSTTLYLLSMGLPYSTTDANGWTTASTYDGLGRTLTTTPPGLPQPGIKYTYPAPDAGGNVAAPYSVKTEILDTAAGPVYRSAWGLYDGLGRVLQSQVYNADNGQLLVSDTAYGPMGGVVKQSIPYFANAIGGNYLIPGWSQFNLTQYDVLGRKFKTVEPGNFTTLIDYDGLTATSTDPNGHKTARISDALGRTTSVQETNPDGSTYATTVYLYDVADRLTRVQDAQGNLTTIQYDLLGRKIGMHDPDMGAWTYTYDALGNLTSQTDARNQTLAFTYDGLNRLVERKDQLLNSTLASFTYGTALGTIRMRVGMTDLSGSTSWTYADYGRKVTESRTINGVNKAFTTQNDWLGRPLSLNYPDGSLITYQYNALGQPQSMQSDNYPGVYLADLAYNALGQVTCMGFGNGATLTNAYDSTTQRLQNRRADANGVNLMNFSYTYDNGGNITQIVDATLNETLTYQYDGLDRLTLATDNTTGGLVYSQGFSYDKLGDILRVDNSGTLAALPSGARKDLADQVLQETAGARPAMVSYAPRNREESVISPRPVNQISNTFTVTKTQDTADGVCDSDCSLREAIIAANANTGTDLIVIPAGIYTLSRTGTGASAGDLDVTTPMVLQGSGATATIIRGAAGWTNRIIEIDFTANPNATAEFKDISIEGGNLTSGSGGGIRSASGSLVFSRVIINGNSTNSYGGGMYIYGGSLSMSDSAVINNNATYNVNSGGGIYYTSGATLSLTNVTISGNNASSYGGGIRGNGAGTATLTNVTISNNTITSAGSSGGGIALTTSGVVSLKNTILAGNFDLSTSSVHPDCEGSLTSLGNNIIGNKSGCTVTATTGDFIGTATSPVSAGLYPLADNGGNTWTHALQSNSLAVNAGDPSSCPAYDQRGILRDAACDMGAFEFQVPPTPTSTPTPTATATSTQTATQTGTPTSTATATGTATQTLTPTITNTATITSTVTRTSVASRTPTGTGTATATSTGTATGTAVLYTSTVTPTPANTPTGTPTVTPTAPPALAGFWQMEELSGTSILDGSGAGNHGTLTGGARIPAGANGRAVSLSGASTYITVPYASSLEPANGFTLSAWVNPGQAASGTVYTILNKGGANQDYVLQVNASGYVEFRLADLTPSNVTGPKLPLNTWSMVAGTYDRSNSLLKLYVNGSLVASRLVTGGAVAYNGSALYFGYTSNPWVGALDEIRLYNRALSDAEVAAVAGSFPTPTPLPSITPSGTPANPTSTSTPLPAGAIQWGTGADGNLTINSGATFNLNTQNSGARTCADGGDAVAYSVTSLGSTIAMLSASPTSGCLNTGDEVMLINTQDPTGSNYSLGNYEFLRIAFVNGSQVSFASQKTRFYGLSFQSDSGVGVGAGDQKVMLMRIPNYNNMTINGTLTANPWNGSRFGVLAFRAAGTLSGAGSLSASGLGYGDSFGPGAGGQGGTTDTGEAQGGGGGYGTPGASGFGSKGGAGGITYGSAQNERLYLGSGGGSSGDNKAGGTGNPGGSGAGVLFAAGRSISFTGTFSANGSNGLGNAGGGSGGSIRIETYDASLGALNALGGAYAVAGGVGRIALYYQNTAPVFSGSPSPYLARLGAAPSPTPSPTAVAYPQRLDFGDGADGDAVVNAGQTINLNTQTLNPARSCAQGGDAVAYAVIGLTATSASLAEAPLASCLKAGDEVLLVSMGVITNYANAGNYEFLRVGSINWNQVSFTGLKRLYYGASAGADDNIGGGSTQQHVMLMRVPNYRNLTLQGTLTVTAWNPTYMNYRFGVLAFRVSESLSGAGSVSASGAGHLYDEGPGRGEMGATTTSSEANGGGGGYGTPGGTGSCCSGKNGFGGGTYGDAPLGLLHLGSGGGSSGDNKSGGSGNSGGRGGGAVYIAARSISLGGVISANGNNGISAAGAGSGGSIRIEGASISLSSVTANGGVYGVPGGLGRIAVYFNGSYNGPACTAANSCYLENAGLTPTPTATGAAPTPLPTATTTALPPGAVAYTYGSTTHVHAVTALSNGNSYVYDANGNMTQRVVGGVTWNLTYNAENRTQSLGSGAYTATYLYDGDGARVGQLAGSAVTYYFMGGAYEVSGTLSGGVFTESGHVQYYAIAGQRVAMERGGALNYLLTDQLGSTVALLDGNGAMLGRQRYLPFGQVRPSQGTIPQTDLGFTGQRLLGGGSGLMDYKARFYDGGLGRFNQPDPIVPDPNDPQDYNRFSYALNSPSRYTDPTGHMADAGGGGGSKACIGPKYCMISDNRYQAYFQMEPVFDTYYFAQSAEETYTDYQGGGDSKYLPKLKSKSDSVIHQGNPANLLLVANDFLIGFRSIYYDLTSPYDQTISLNYITSYQGIPRVDAKKTITVTGMEIKNNSSFSNVINYTVGISGGNNPIISTISAASGQTASLQLPDIEAPAVGLKVTVIAFTGCIGPCIRMNNPTVFRGYTSFNFTP